MDNIRYVPGDGRVTVINDTSYAKIHNEGGVIQPTVTQKMRKFAWAKFFESGGKNATVPEEAEKWRRMALTKKTKLNIRIPQRRFMGQSKELAAEIKKKGEQEVFKIINS